MRHFLYSISITIMLVLGTTQAEAQKFFDTSAADYFFDFGIRAGINTSNRTISSSLFNEYCHNSWGADLETGAVVDFRFNNWISIQPGFFYECRKGSFIYVNQYETQSLLHSQYGDWRRHVGTVPIMLSMHFNLSNDLQWVTELGPYWQFRFASRETPIYYGDLSDIKIAQPRDKDFGIKIGTGMTLLNRFYFGIHYLMGLKSVWEDGLGGRNKTWTFTVGYTIYKTDFKKAE